MVVQKESEVRMMFEAGETQRDFYPRFSEKEYKARYQKVRNLMEEMEVDCLIVYGDGGFYLVNEANVRYLSNYYDFLNSYVVFPYDGDPTLFVGLRYYIPIAKATSVIEDIRWPEGFLDSADIADRVKELKLEKGKIGIVGISSARSPWIPYDHFLKLKDGLPSAKFVNVTEKFEEVRQVLSEEEIEWLKKGIELTDLSVEAIADAVKPGATLHEVYAAAYEPLKKGGAMALCIVGPLNNPPMLHPMMFPSDRVLEIGDILHAEISVSYGGYSGQILRMISMGEPSESYLKMHDVAVNVYSEIQKEMKIGVKAEDIQMRGAQIIKEAGLSGTVLAHGWGMSGLTRPIIYTQHILGKEIKISGNMIFIIEPLVGSEDAKYNVFVGETNIVTENGGVSYHKLPLEFIVK